MERKDCERKIQKRFVDKGFGFPVVLVNVPMVKIREVWTPDIDYNKLAVRVLTDLAVHPARLTGNEVRFIRHHLEMTLEAFAKRFGVSHPAVIKWERHGDEPANINWGTEKDLRLFVLDRLGATPKAVGEAYLRLDRPVSARTRLRPVEVLRRRSLTTKKDTPVAGRARPAASTYVGAHTKKK